MIIRKGAARGTGRGYKNLRAFPRDSSIHKQSARGQKQPQRINIFMAQSGKEPTWDLPKTKWFGKSGKADYAFQCMECGRKFKNAREECPNCGGADIDLYVPSDQERFKSKSGKDSELTVRKLRLAYEKAVADGRPEFTVEGKTFVTNYAKYMLEYLKMRKLKDRDTFTLTEESGKAPHHHLMQKKMTMQEKLHVTKHLKLKDQDKDGVADVLDCDHQNPDKQDDFAPSEYSVERGEGRLIGSVGAVGEGAGRLIGGVGGFVGGVGDLLGGYGKKQASEAEAKRIYMEVMRLRLLKAMQEKHEHSEVYQ